MLYFIKPEAQNYSKKILFSGFELLAQKENNHVLFPDSLSIFTV